MAKKQQITNLEKGDNVGYALGNHLRIFWFTSLYSTINSYFTDNIFLYFFFKLSISVWWYCKYHQKICNTILMTLWLVGGQIRVVGDWMNRMNFEIGRFEPFLLRAFNLIVHILSGIVIFYLIKSLCEH